MTITTTSVKTNTVQQKSTTSDIKKMDNSVAAIGKTLANNKTDKVKNEKEIAKIEAKIAQKTEELNQILNKIEKKEYIYDKEIVGKEKYPISYYGSQIAMSVGAAGGAGLLAGVFTADAPLAILGGAVAAIGAVAGAGFAVYFDYMSHNIPDEEVKDIYTQKANDLKAEIAGLKEELSKLR